MDFKDVLAQEILAKKTRLEEAKAVTGKYARRGDVEHIGVREGTSDGTGQVQGRDDEEPDVRVDEQEASKKRSRLHTDESVLSERLEDDEEVLPSALNDNIERLLKSRSQPIRLFGETDRQRSDRLKVIMTKDFLEDDKIGQKNEYQRTVTELQKRRTDEATGREAAELVSAMEAEEVSVALLKENQEKTRALVLLFFKRLVKEWGAHLDSQDETQKKSSQGRMSLVLYKQSKESLGVFFKQLNKDQLAKDVLENVTRICHHMQNREYVKANDVYLRLAIGNAPWPIGVTNVGIHERSARERISSSQIAHVLNDEASRKWLQAIKRLITFCQTKYPPALRSQMMG